MLNIPSSDNSEINFTERIFIPFGSLKYQAFFVS